MKLLLTSNGLSNPSIIKALESLMGKRAHQSKLVFVPTAANPSEHEKDWLIDDMYRCKEAGFAVHIVDIAVQPLEVIERQMKDADVLLFGGGNTYYLLDWIEKSGLSNILPELLKTKVYVGISAGSIATAPKVLMTSQRLFGDEDSEAVKDVAGLNLVNFHFRPHLNSPSFPKINKENMDLIAKDLGAPLYVMDDMGAVKVDGDKIEIITEGEYLSYNV